MDNQTLYNKTQDIKFRTLKMLLTKTRYEFEEENMLVRKCNDSRRRTCDLFIEGYPIDLKA